MLVAAAASPAWPSPLLPSERAGERVALLGAIADGAARAALTALGARSPGDRAVLGDWLVRRRGGRRARRRDRRRRRRQRAGLARVPRDAPARASFGRARARAALLHGAARRSGRRCSRCRSAANLGAAWLLIEATTAASALLVAFTRQAARARGRLEVPRADVARARRRAARASSSCRSRSTAADGPVGLAYTSIHAAAPGARPSARAARLPAAPGRPGREDRLGAGPQLAARRALARLRAPVSALLSAALLPAVLLVAWRVAAGARRRRRRGHRAHVFIFFGLVSLAVAVPFLWRPLAWKRLLAYSSLEHMGVIALGIGFGSPLALAGVDRARRRPRAREVARLLRGDCRCSASQPAPARTPPRGVARVEPAPRRGRRRLPRRARRPAALAAVRLRADDRRSAASRPGYTWAVVVAAASCSRSASSASPTR